MRSYVQYDVKIKYNTYIHMSLTNSESTVLYKLFVIKLLYAAARAICYDM